MEEKKNNKGLICLIVILIVLVLGLVGYIVYDELFSYSKVNDKITTTTTNNIIENVSLYEMKETEVIGTFISSDGDYLTIKDENDNIKLKYPVINIKSNEIKDINKKIKNNIDLNIKNLNAYESMSEEFEDTCIKIKMTDTNKSIIFEHFTYIAYEIIESDKYLTIIEKEQNETTCASGFVEIKNIYIIDKETKKIIKRENLINSYSNFDILLKDLINLLNVDERPAEIIDSINKGEYYIYISENNNLSIRFLNISGSGYEIYEYQNNHWEFKEMN